MKIKNIFLILLILIFLLNSPTLALRYNRGDQGNEIKRIQEMLKKIGYRISIDGGFGYETQQAVKKFQREHDLKVDGIIGRQTYNKLKKEASQRILFQFGDKGKKIKELQEMFINIGYHLEPNGYFGHRTTGIVKEFQRNNDLRVDGIVGNSTYNTLKRMKEDITYTVKAGDNLTKIANKFNTTIKFIKTNNELSSEQVFIGQKLKIPRGGIGGDSLNLYTPITHIVQRGDALSLIAKKYGVDIATIELANQLTSSQIYAGQELIIPHVRAGIDRPFFLGRDPLISPIDAPTSSPFGWRVHPITGSKTFHQGHDFSAPLGTPIRAAAGGKVIKSGWWGGYGHCIVIDHGNNVRTLYAHSSELLVQAGEHVQAGDIIAKIGSTGISTGPHLHFEILIDEEATNPLEYLP
ncbi:MAG: peptidoglycan DD-metalloendopeptidase family protein [bacterium]